MLIYFMLLYYGIIKKCMMYVCTVIFTFSAIRANADDKVKRTIEVVIMEPPG